MDAREQTPLVLAVDNFADWHWVTQDVLKKNKIKLVFAGSVEEAMRLLAEENFSLIISWVKMPAGSGYDILKFAEGRRIPFILCTSYPQEMIPEVEYEKFIYVWKGEIKNLASEVSRLLRGSA